MKIPAVLLFALSTASISRSADATTYVIRPDGSGDFPTIQAAITAPMMPS